MEKNLIRRMRIEWALLLLLPIAILSILLFSTWGAPERFHLITVSSYALIAVVGIALSILNRRFRRVSVLMHLVWLSIYTATSIFQYFYVASISNYPGDSRLSGLLWVTIYLGYALVAPIAASVAWITTSKIRARLE